MTALKSTFADIQVDPNKAIKGIYTPNFSLARSTPTHRFTSRTKILLASISSTRAHGKFGYCEYFFRLYIYIYMCV
jgi:hypothetical protein